ncbi:MAG: calcium/proton exchanger [Planctomycetales bacterium]|nr:calcium/proton exchanger [Planctomycetales bacterium]
MPETASPAAASAPGPDRAVRRLDRVFATLLVFVPASIACRYAGAPPAATFVTAVLALVPIARFIGRGTSDLALRANDAIAALLAATFGNLIELAIAGLALRAGLVEVVKASIVGSVMGNILLLIGLSMFAGGLRFKDQKFNRRTAGVSSTMLIIAVTGLSMPTVFVRTSPQFGGRDLPLLSAFVSVVLAITYVCGLVFAFRTHRHLFDVTDEMREAREKPVWSARVAAAVLAASTLAAAVEAELLVSVLEPAGKALGLTQTFIGVVFIAIVTNIAEKTSAILYALRNNVNLSIEIGTSSAIQIALFVVPILVVVGALVGTPFTLEFSVLEVAAMMFAVMIVNYLSADGVCNWLEGVQLLAVYFVLAAGFFLAG